MKTTDTSISMNKDRPILRFVDLATLVLSYVVVAFAVEMGMRYELEGHGLHPALAFTVGLVGVTCGLVAFVQNGNRNKESAGE